jgi:3'(2'), 5'-bisphosphate nucleotidase
MEDAQLAAQRPDDALLSEEGAAALGAEPVGMGSAGAKAMAVVRGVAHAHIHSGGQYEWNSAAVAGACGRPLVNNWPDPYLPDLIVCRPEIAEAVLRAIRVA